MPVDVPYKHVWEGSAVSLARSAAVDWSSSVSTVSAHARQVRAVHQFGAASSARRCSLESSARARQVHASCGELSKVSRNISPT